MSWDAFGAALDDWISGKVAEKKREKGLGAIGTLEKERDANDQYQGAQKRTDEWLASLSPEDLQKVRPDSTRVASNFEGIGDVKNFDLDKRQRQLGLTSEFSTLPEVQNYIKTNDVEKKNKLNTDISTDLQKAAMAISGQRKKQDNVDNYKKTGDILSELNITMPDTGKSEPFSREGMNRFNSPEMQFAEVVKEVDAGKPQLYNPLEFQKKDKGYSDLGGKLLNYEPEKPLSNREVWQKFGLNKYDDPRIKDFYEQNVKDPENLASKEKIAEQKRTGTSGTAVWSQKKALMEQDPEAIPKLKAQIEGLRNSGTLSDISADYFLERLTTDPVTTAINIDDYVKKPEIAGKTVDAQTAPKVRQKTALIEPTAAGSAANTEATEKKKREIQAGNPILSEAQGGALSDAYNAVNYLNTLKSAIKNNNLGYFDIDRKTGQFVNPEAGDAFLQLVEIVGRKRSGAAISDSEWKNFGKQVLNKNNLLTEAGKKTAIEGLDRYLDKFYGAGVTTTGNEDWYNNYKSKSKSARQKAEGTTEPPAKKPKFKIVGVK